MSDKDQEHSLPPPHLQNIRIKGARVGIHVGKGSIRAENVSFENVEKPLEVEEGASFTGKNVEATRPSDGQPARRRVFSVPDLPWKRPRRDDPPDE